MNQWISVKDRLPEPGERVLVTDGNAVFEQYRRYQFINHGSWHWDRYDGMSIITDVTHWMPLPNPPDSERT